MRELVVERTELVSASAPQPSRRTVIVNIQVLRAIAAAIVVYYHLQPMVRAATGTHWKAHFGASGVDIFFVVSGFIMFQTTRSFRRTTVQFWLDRALRIVPLYWAATAVLIGIYLTGRHPNGLGLIDAGDVVTSLLFIPHIRADGLKEPVLSLGWTLFYEMFFYLVFGLTFFLRSHVKSLVAIVTLFSALIWVGVVFGPLPYALNYYTNPIVLEFGAGCLLSLLYVRFSSVSARRAAWLGYALVVGGALLIVGSDYYASGLFMGWFLRPIVFGVPACLIVAGALVLEKAGHIWNSRLLLLTGSASYALYLIHPMVLQPVTKLFGHAVQAKLVPGAWLSLAGGHALSALVALVAFGAALACGIAVHQWVELPMHRKLLRLVFGSPLNEAVGAGEAALVSVRPECDGPVLPAKNWRRT